MTYLIKSKSIMSKDQAKASNLEERILEVLGMSKSYLHKRSMAKIIKATNFFENLMYSSIRYFYRFLS